MLTAVLGIMFQFVSAIKDILEIHSQVVEDQRQQHQDQKLLILVDHLHVESMLNVETEVVLPLVYASLDFKEILMWSASMSAQSTQSVHLILLVSPTNAEIHVLEYVDLMPLVMSTTTSHLAHVIQDTLGIHSLHVTELQHCQFLQRS